MTGTLRIIDGKRRPAAGPASIAGATSQRPCGTGCWRFSVPRAGPVLVLAVGASRDRRIVRLLATWDRAGDAGARRILGRAQRSMRRLQTLRQVETVQSAGATGTGGRVEFGFRSPDRMTYETASAESVVIGARSWIRPDPITGWLSLARADEDFRVRDGFRWTVFASTARLVAVHRERGRRVAELALLDWGYPLWYRLTVDLRTGRVLRQTLVTPENRIEDRYFAFDRPLEVTSPTSAARGNGAAGDG